MRIKAIFFIILITLVIVFTLQNTQIVEVKMFFWHLSLSRALMIFVMFALGAICGMFFNRCKKDKKDK